ncbi:inner membrane-spanning protein YciB [Caulobacter sp. 602-1]|uniref:inner membrane-spanning protein YciB n=1 Tax=unclassified Caulobacter TaxID=2648921 RepID=UPI000F634D23|nr:inner membrane-spanning protein YciB [Caulobacter sp. 602-1]RRN62510.1 intracellular septation protein A [Caulobacter sp. 602-1]
MSEAPAETEKKSNGWVRTVVDYGAAIAFGVAYFVTKDFQKATWVLVAASAAALAIGFAVERRLALLPLFFGGMALIFGALGLIFHSDVFVKIKVTVINLALAAFLFGGVFTGRQPLKLIMGEALHLSDAAWRTLTLRYGGYFGVVALLNEIVRNTQDTDTWVKFRLGLLPLALVFVATQVPFMMKHMAKGDEPAAVEPPDAGF